MTIPTILVVQDDTLNLELVRDVLLKASMKVVEARTAHEGLRAALELAPAVILLDIRLPDMDGFAALGQLKSNPATASIPVVALTAQAMTGDQERALAAGFSDYIPKPIDTRTLADRIRALLAPGQPRRTAGSEAA